MSAPLNINAVLNRILSRHDLPSDYALAKKAEFSNQLIANWRHGRTLPDEKGCMKLAALANMDGHVLIARCHAARAKDGEVAAIWLAIAERLERAPS